ncbi:MAG: Asp-tRNA(Asn)/Glu-tRNA(Gln) amidotransferase subunit GatA [Anaplasmataceae bacterium]|nr:Asp-tRNA(Asn)/Glu-tRNA(Gln) amidotransferase subunit GatA [Anaplasmataceae bacterium]
MINLRELTIKNLHDHLVKKSFTALEITQAYFSHIKDSDKNIGAFLSLHEEQALQSAEKTDLRIAAGENIHTLSGTPLAIKDNLLVKNLPATAASRILEKYTASYDATVIKKLREAGSVFLGKTNLDEFAMGSSTENSAFKLTRNPHDTKKVPGGSSGGSAAAVASHMALGALGTDTGGSIRQPAGFCGITGLKPTYGAVSRFGAIAMASSLDQIGPFGKTVEDVAILFNTIRGEDPYDATSTNANYNEQKIINPKLEDVRKLRIGLPKEYFTHQMDPEVTTAIESTIDKLKNFKIEFKEISLPHTEYALATYYIIMPAEVSSNLARFDGIRYARREKALAGAKNLEDFYREERGQGFGAEAKRRIILGTFVLSSGYYDAYYAKAQKVRTLLKKDFDEAFKEVDVILTPVSPTTAFNIGEKTSDPLEMYLSDIFTITVNLVGLPALSLPTGYNAKLPIGFQLIGKHFREEDILGLGQYYEKLG